MYTETKGKFIVFEGIDGSGKSTQAKRAYEYLCAKGLKCRLCAEPTDGEMGKLLRLYLEGKKKADSHAVAGLFAADRIDHITKDGGILSLLSSGVNIICDRYYLSSCAYQGIDCDLDFILSQNRFALENAMPDLTFYIDISVEVAMQRIIARGDTEIFEDADKQRKIYENYQKLLEMPQNKGIKIINGERRKEEIAEDVVDVLDGLFFGNV